MTQSLVYDARHPPYSGSALVRLLASFDDVASPVSKQAFAERLSRWFEWREAIALSAVLNATPSRAVSVRQGVHQEACRVRAALDKLIEDPAPAIRPRYRSSTSASIPAEPPADFATLRERYVAAQRGMASRIAALRQVVRDALTATSPAMAALAALDAVMEQVVGEHEHALLERLPHWLEPRFETSDATTFTRELQAVLRAELELRWQPIVGLLDALHEASFDAVPTHAGSA